VAQFAGHPVSAVPDPAVKDDAASHTRAQRKEDHAADALRGAPPLLAEGGCVGVILDHHGIFRAASSVALSGRSFQSGKLAT